MHALRFPLAPGHARLAHRSAARPQPAARFHGACRCEAGAADAGGAGAGGGDAAGGSGKNDLGGLAKSAAEAARAKAEEAKKLAADIDAKKVADAAKDTAIKAGAWGQEMKKKAVDGTLKAEATSAMASGGSAVGQAGASAMKNLKERTWGDRIDHWADKAKPMVDDLSAKYEQAQKDKPLEGAKEVVNEKLWAVEEKVGLKRGAVVGAVVWLVKGAIATARFYWPRFSRWVLDISDTWWGNILFWVAGSTILFSGALAWAWKALLLTILGTPFAGNQVRQYFNDQVLTTYDGACPRCRALIKTSMKFQPEIICPHCKEDIRASNARRIYGIPIGHPDKPGGEGTYFIDPHTGEHVPVNANNTPRDEDLADAEFLRLDRMINPSTGATKFVRKKRKFGDN